jgi:hypothetical protein
LLLLLLLLRVGMRLPVPLPMTVLAVRLSPYVHCISHLLLLLLSC